MSSFILDNDYFVIMSHVDIIMKKKVTFSNIIFVRLIQTRLEFNFENFICDLWWSAKDYTNFKVDAFNEMLKFRLKYPDICYNDRKDILYQPNNFYDDNE
jgi:hypothetical protein